MPVESLSVLLVEDEALVALELESILVDDGFTVCGVADRKEEALRIAAEKHPDVALVDLHLADGLTGPEIARIVADSGCTVVFMTANLTKLPRHFDGVLGAIPKPYTENGFRAALRYLRTYCTGGKAKPPASLMRLDQSAPEMRRT